MAGPTKAEIELERDRLAADLRRAQQEMEQFRKRVVEKAVEVAADQNWCDEGLHEALESLGLDVPEKEYEVTAIIRLTFTGMTKVNEIHEQFIADSLTDVDRIGLDGDWSEYQHRDTSITIETYEEI